MKKITIFISALFLFSNIFATNAVASLSGTGTESDPFLISTLDDLIALSTDESKWVSDYYFVQTADIDATSTAELNDGAGFSPIGISNKNFFQGKYNGKGYKISGLTIMRDQKCCALFGCAKSSLIDSVALVDVNILNENNNTTAGIVAQLALGTVISNSYVTGRISGNASTGGIVGFLNSGTIINSYANCEVLGLENVGGLVGKARDAIISNCYSKGIVNCSDQKAGGLVGWIEGVSTSITNSYSTSYVINYNMVNDTYVAGGFAGNIHTDVTAGALSNCYYDRTTSNTNLEIGSDDFEGAELKDSITALTTNEFKTTDFGFDFGIDSANPWVADANGRPYLNIQTGASVSNGVATEGVLSCNVVSIGSASLTNKGIRFKELHATDWRTDEETLTTSGDFTYDATVANSFFLFDVDTFLLQPYVKLASGDVYYGDLTMYLKDQNMDINKSSVTSELNFYPNPAKDVITISGGQVGEILTITSIRGQVMLKTILEEDQTINISNLCKGLYIVSVNNSSHMLSKN